MTWYLVGIVAVFATVVIGIVSQRGGSLLLRTSHTDPWLAMCAVDDEEEVWALPKEDNHELVLPREEIQRWVK
jgi:hypothetical protein